MHMFTTLSLVAYATLIVAAPTTRSPYLMKRHFWCNGVDSEDICPEGQRMTPIDDYACGLLASDKRLDEVSPPENGQSSINCPGQSDSHPDVHEEPSHEEDQPSHEDEPSHDDSTQHDTKSEDTTKAVATDTTTVHHGPGRKKVHLSCTKVDGVVGSWEVLNCTTTAAL